MQGQSRFAHPLPHLLQGVLRLGFTATKNHEVVRVPPHRPTRRRHLVIERVEVKIRQQRADDAALGRATLGRSPIFILLQHPGPEESLHQRHHPAVSHALRHQSEQAFVGDRVEVAFQVGVHHPVVACLEQRVLGPAPRSEAGTVLGKLRLEDRFQNVPERSCSCSR